MADQPCLHPDFAVFVDVGRILPDGSDESDMTIPPAGYVAEILVQCAACDERFVFVGAPVGGMPDKPCISPDGLELRAPLRPQSADPHFGLGLAGFIARVQEGEAGHAN